MSPDDRAVSRLMAVNGSEKVHLLYVRLASNLASMTDDRKIVDDGYWLSNTPVDMYFGNKLLGTEYKLLKNCT